MFRLILNGVAILVFATPIRADDQPTVADLVDQLESVDPGKRVIAAEMLGEMGQKAADAIPALAKVIRGTKLPDREDSPLEAPTKKVAVDRNDMLRFFAARDALVRIGPKAAPALAQLLSHDSGVARGLIAEAIGWLGPDGVEAVAALAKTLADENPTVQIYAADALAKIGPKAEAAIPALVALLGDPKTKDPHVITPNRSSNPKNAATRALMQFGAKGTSVVKEKVLPALIEEYKTAKPTPWDGPGLSVLAMLGTDAAPAIPAIKDYILRREKSSNLDSLAPTLLKLGPEGVKAYLELLADKRVNRRDLIGSLAHSRVYSPREDITPFIPVLVAALNEEDKSIRNSAVWALSYLGEKAPPEVIDAMVAALADPSDDLIAAFERLGAAAVPTLLRAVKSKDTKLREAAVGALARIGGAAQEALPTLRELARDKDIKLAIAASASAARISLDPKDAATVFLALKNEDAKIRREALRHVRELELLAVPYQTHLIALLTDKDDFIKEQAIETIANLGADAPDAIAALADTLPPPEKWRSGLRGYGKPLGPAFRPAVPVLIKALSNGNEDIRFQACTLLGQIGPGAHYAVPDLIDLLGVTRESYRVEAILETLASIGPRATEAIPLLARNVKFTAVVMCLGSIGPEAKVAIPALKKSLTDPDPLVRLAATFALARIEKDVVKYRDALVRSMLPPPGDHAQVLILKVFDNLAPDCPELIPSAVRLFPKLTPAARGDLVASIGKYGPAAKGVVPDLLKLMADEDGMPQYEQIARTLGAIGPDAIAALPELRKLLNHPELKVAIVARDAIAKIQPRKTSQ